MLPLLQLLVDEGRVGMAARVMAVLGMGVLALDSSAASSSSAASAPANVPPESPDARTGIFMQPRIVAVRVEHLEMHIRKKIL